MNDSYFLRVLLALDRLANTVLGGSDKETISSRAGRHAGEDQIASNLAHLLDLIDQDHVFKSLNLPEPEVAVLRLRFEEWRKRATRVDALPPIDVIQAP